MANPSQQVMLSGGGATGPSVTNSAIASSGSTSQATLNPTFTSNSGDIIIAYVAAQNATIPTGYTQAGTKTDAQGYIICVYYKTSTGDTTVSITGALSVVVAVVKNGAYSAIGSFGTTVSGTNTTTPGVTLSGSSLVLLCHSYYPNDAPLGTPTATGFTHVNSNPDQPREATAMLRRATSTTLEDTNVSWGVADNSPRTAVFVVLV